jgi:hypothetical protein
MEIGYFKEGMKHLREEAKKEELKHKSKDVNLSDIVKEKTSLDQSA